MQIKHNTKALMFLKCSTFFLFKLFWMNIMMYATQSKLDNK